MAKLVYGLNMSLDGYVDHAKIGPPVPELFRYFIKHMQGLSGLIYGRTMYEIMSYWDDDRPDDDETDREFAAAWRSKPKWVISSTLKSVGPNATLVADNVEATIRKLKTQLSGEIEIGGTILAHNLFGTGLIDEYQIYLRPIVLGTGKPFFAGPPSPLRLAASDLIAEGALRLTFVPA